MKHIGYKLAAVVLVISMLMTGVSATLGNAVFTRSVTLSDGVTMTNGIWSVTNEKNEKTAVQENYFVYTTDAGVWPIVAYGDTLYGRSTMAEIAKKVTAKDLTIVAGINASFFELSNGIPYGIVVTEGILRSSGSTAAVGFLPNGKTLIGEPNVAIKLQSTLDNQMLGYNKALSQANGFMLYSPDYDTRTKNTISAYHLILKPTSAQSAQLRLGQSVELTVTGIVTDTKSCDIPSDGFVLCVAEQTAYPSALELIKSYQLGDKLTISVSAESDWQNVVYAVGGGDMLIENGKSCTEFTLDSAKKSAARTAIGVRADGSLVLYTADSGNGSSGLTLAELAARMQAAGCKYALNLDGGGSTTAGAQYPGYLGNATVNRPADGSQRACANYIFLVRKTASAAQAASRLFLYPYDGQPVLAGARLALTTKAVDASYTAAELPETVTYSAKNGSVSENGILTVDKTRTAADPYVTVTARSGSLTTQTKYNILDSVTAIAVKRDGTDAAFTKAMLAGGSTTELTAAASYYGMSVTAQDDCFTWTVTGDIGVIDSSGTFRAVETNEIRTGTIQVSYGSTVTKVDVTIAPADPFADMKGHWAKDYVNDLYFAGVLTGSTGSDGKQRYRPDDSMTREEFVVALMRFLGVNTADYSGVTLPFADEKKIDSWALDAVKAAYSLKYLGGSSSGGKLYAKPLDTISRQEAMAILSRTQTLPESIDVSVLNAFSDAGKVEAWAKTSVAAMVQMKVIGGSNGKLNPTGNVTRAEVAKMLYGLQDSAE